MNIFRRLTCILLVSGLVLAGSTVFARDLSYRFPQDQVAAAYLYNFALFTDWPANALAGRDVFVIATFDRKFATLAAKTLAGRQVDGRPVTVRFVEDVAELAPVQLVYFAGNFSKGVEGALAQFADRPILTVGSLPDFTASGGMIELYTIENRLRFSINLDAAAAAGVSISSEVLKLAESVQDSGRAEALK